MSRARILIVDNDPDFRNYFGAFLRKDFLVAVAADERDGFAKALAHPPDLITLEIMIPDGLRVLRMFRENPILRQIPIMVVSKDASRANVVAAAQAGAADYAVKQSLLGLVDRIRKLMSRQGGDSSKTPPAMPTPEMWFPAPSSISAPLEFQEDEVLALIDDWE